MSEELEVMHMEENNKYQSDEHNEVSSNIFSSNGSRIELKHIITLIINPVKFFNSGIKLANKLYLVIVLMILGITYVIERIEGKLLKSSYDMSYNSTIDYLFGTWLHYWLFVISVGFSYAFIVWYIMGWWYNLRLKWCSDSEIDNTNGKIVFIYNKLIYAIPVVIFTVIASVFYKNIQMAYLSDNSWYSFSSIVLSILIILSTINSYRSVNRIFDLKRGPAIIWFLALPIFTYATPLLLLLMI